MKYCGCIVPAASLYREPDHRSEIMNQLLFGDTMALLEEYNSTWIKIRNGWDGYEGWILRGQTSPMQWNVMDTPRVRWVAPIVSQPFTLLYTGDSSMIIPFGASLMGLGAPVMGLDWHVGHHTMSGDELKGSVGMFTYKYRPEGGKKTLWATIADVDKLARLWLHTPYLWGGRTLMGVDCSGFAQTLFKVMGICLPRDAKDQAKEGTLVGFLQEAKAGDLAFFDDEQGVITHVGVLLSDRQIIHAAGGTGRVQIDYIDNEGIVRSDTGQRTHRLRVIKRFEVQRPATLEAHFIKRT